MLAASVHWLFTLIKVGNKKQTNWVNSSDSTAYAAAGSAARSEHTLTDNNFKSVFGDSFLKAFLLSWFISLIYSFDLFR